MTVLITGAAGFIGSHTAEKLLSLGHHVVGLDNLVPYYDPGIKMTNLKLARSHHNFTFVKGDIRDEKLLNELFEKHKFNLVIHLAAMTGVRPSLNQAPLYSDVNIKGTLNILEAMRQHGCSRMVFASSSSVYGNNQKVPFEESDFVDNPISPYAATKKAGELMCYAYHHIYKMHISCLRFFTVYGPRQRPDMAISKFCRAIMEGQPIPVFGDGQTKRDYTFIHDIVDGILKSADRLKGYEVFNLAYGKTTTLHALIEAIENALGKKARIDRLPMQPGDVNLTCGAIDKARKLLDYHPETSIREGIKYYLEWLNTADLIYHNA